MPLTWAFVLLAIGALGVLPGASPFPAPTGSPVIEPQVGAPSAAAPDDRKLAERERKVQVARERFADAVKQVGIAHGLFASTTRASVIYEVLKEQAGSGRCREELATAKTDSGRARQDLGSAVRGASTKFEQAVSAAGAVDSEFFKKGIGRSADDEFPWYPKDARDAIRKRLKQLAMLYKYVDSSMTKDNHRSRLWKAAKDYEAMSAEHGVPKASATALIPSAIEVPCIRKRIDMHVSSSR